MNFLVPIDFTPISKNALLYALRINAIVPGKIEALHIVSKENQREQAENNFVELINSLEPSASEKIETKIKVGDIYQDIGAEVENGKFELIVMGTHGPRGLQKVFGSRAIKVITSSKTPFIVTQSSIPDDNIESIVLPIDLSRESVQIIQFACDLATKFSAEIHIVYHGESDEWLQKKIKSNLGIAELLIKKTKVKYELQELAGKQSFQDQVIEYSSKIAADLIAVAHHSESIIPQFDTFSQDVITNGHQIPVLIIDAHQVSNVSSKYSFLTV